MSDRFDEMASELYAQVMRLGITRRSDESPALIADALRRTWNEAIEVAAARCDGLDHIEVAIRELKEPKR